MKVPFTMIKKKDSFFEVYFKINILNNKVKELYYSNINNSSL